MFADIHHMLDFERQELMENTDWRTVLTAYRERRDTAKADDPEFEGWLDRIMAIDGIDEDALRNEARQAFVSGAKNGEPSKAFAAHTFTWP